jgi:hypothetical protein
MSDLVFVCRACLSVLSLVSVSGCSPQGKGKLTTDEGRPEAAVKHTETRLAGRGGCIQAKAVNGVGNRMLEQRRGSQGGV